MDGACLGGKAYTSVWSSRGPCAATPPKMAEEEAPKVVQRDPDDILKDWFKARVVSSFKYKPEAADVLLTNDANRVAVETFLNNEQCQRLLVFSDPDLKAVRVGFWRSVL